MMNNLLRKAIAPSTRKVYAAGVRRFKAFCSSQQLPHLPASELTIRLFCTAQASRVSFSTISTYVSAIRMLHLQHGLQDPTVHAPLLTLLLRGIKRQNRPNSLPRQPVTTDILQHLKPALRSLTRNSYQATLYWAAFTLAFYAFLRVGEYTSRARTRRSSTTLLASSVTLKASSIIIRLTKSKTSQFQSPPPIHIGATNTATCPVAAMQSFLSRRRASSQLPLFVFRDGTYLTPNLVSSTLKASLRIAGYNPAAYSSHSFRIGAATSASASGMADHLIQKLGRWKSDAFKTYVRPDKKSLSKSSKAMAQTS